MRRSGESRPLDGLAGDPEYAAIVGWRNFWAAVAIGFLILIIATAVLDAATTRSVHRRFVVGAPPHLVVREGVGGTQRGGVEVRAGGAGELVVDGEVHGTWRVHYAVEQRGDEIFVEAEPSALLGWLSLLGPARFAITAPAATRLDVTTVSSPIDVAGITGGGAVSSTNGTIRVARSGGQLAASSTNGAIAVSGFDGRAELRSTNGAIKVEGLEGSAAAQTTNGAIGVSAGRGTFELGTTNGSVALDAELGAAGVNRAQTTNGAVTVRLRGSPSLRIDAQTTNGRIVARRPLAAAQETHGSLRGSIGGGEGELVLRTVNGGISIE